MHYHRIVEIKPGHQAQAMEYGPKFMELAKKILGENYKGMQFLTKVHGNLGWLMWRWEHESMDQDIQNSMKLNQNAEWQAMIDEFAPHLIDANDYVSYDGNDDYMQTNFDPPTGNSTYSAWVYWISSADAWKAIFNSANNNQ